jgi:transcriptional regulator with XRE-family HTH domain
LAKLTKLSDPYVSQLERGLHTPSIRVLKALAEALNVRAETLLQFAGLFEIADDAPSVEEAIAGDKVLTDQQKLALLGVYRGFLERHPER